MSKLTMMIKIVSGIPSIVHAHWNNLFALEIMNLLSIGIVAVSTLMMLVMSLLYWQYFILIIIILDTISLFALKIVS